MQGGAAAAAARNTSIFTDRAANGPAHRAQTAIRLNAPAEFFMTEAADSTTEAASDMMPPTTGRELEITVLAVLTATWSVLPAISPVSVI